MRSEVVVCDRSRDYLAPLTDLGLQRGQLDYIERLSGSESQEVVIADIDQDGFLLSHIGPIQGAPTISDDQFRPRNRHKVQTVVACGRLAVKKTYVGDRTAFLNELTALHALGQAGCNVPSLIAADFDQLTLTFSYISGTVLREELAQKGAVLRDRDVESDPSFSGLSQMDKWLLRIREGKRVLGEVIDERFSEKLFEQIVKIHSLGFVLHDIKYGNVVIEKHSGDPYLIDFEDCVNYRALGRNCLRLLCDQDIEQFNLHFAAQKPTYRTLKKDIQDNTFTKGGRWYSPAYLGYGLRMGPIWSADAGYGRWQYILKDNLPPLSGRRVLDLGANSGFVSIQALRSGARQSVGIEVSDEFIAQGEFLLAAFEWADGVHYDFRYVQTNMEEVPDLDLGKFDIALALCSIYYLDDLAIANLIRGLSTMADVLVLQCNTATDIDRGNPGTYERASTSYAIDALERNGFPSTQTIAPDGYSRPLVIGRKNANA